MTQFYTGYLIIITFKTSAAKCYNQTLFRKNLSSKVLLSNLSKKLLKAKFTSLNFSGIKLVAEKRELKMSGKRIGVDLFRGSSLA